MACQDLVEGQACIILINRLLTFLLLPISYLLSLLNYFSSDDMERESRSKG